MKKKKLLSFFVAAALSLSCFSAVPIVSQAEEAEKYTSGDFVYDLGDGCTITKYTGSAKELVIPSELDGHEVVAIGDYAFANCDSLETITIPEEVTTIGDYAFEYCDLLKTITIPKGVTTIGKGAFWICKSLEAITIPGGVTTMGDFIFEWCDSLKTVTFEKGVTAISGLTFSNCKSLENVTLPEGLKEIGDSAFARCSALKSITIPKGVTKLDFAAFGWCGALESVTLPEGLTEICQAAFVCCGSLRSIEIPKSVESIDISAFSDCEALRDFYDYNIKTEYNEPEEEYENPVFIGAPLLTIHGYKNSNAQEYAAKYNIPFLMITEGGSDNTKMHRLYNPNSGEHFYTGNDGERDSLIEKGWKYEGIAWIAPAGSNTPVYRLYNPNAGDHHYTMSVDERDNLVDNEGWNDEGIGWYSVETEQVPLYRLYNPNATGAGAHHYTTGIGERDHLISIGWKDEGIGWFGLEESDPIAEQAAREKEAEAIAAIPEASLQVAGRDSSATGTTFTLPAEITDENSKIDLNRARITAKARFGTKTTSRARMLEHENGVVTLEDLDGMVAENPITVTITTDLENKIVITVTTEAAVATSGTFTARAIADSTDFSKATDVGDIALLDQYGHNIAIMSKDRTANVGGAYTNNKTITGGFGFFTYGGDHIYFVSSADTTGSGSFWTEKVILEDDGVNGIEIEVTVTSDKGGGHTVEGTVRAVED